MLLSAVRALAGVPYHDRADRRDVDLDVLVVVPRRRPLLGQQAQSVVGAVMLQRTLAAEGRQAGLHGLHIVLHLGRRLFEWTGVPPGDGRLHLPAQSRADAALG